MSGIDAPAPIAPADRRAPRILVVDDERSMRELLAIVLRQVQMRRLRKQVQAEAMVGFDLKLDSLNIRFASSKTIEACLRSPAQE